MLHEYVIYIGFLWCIGSLAEKGSYFSAIFLGVCFFLYMLIERGRIKEGEYKLSEAKKELEKLESCQKWLQIETDLRNIAESFIPADQEDAYYKACNLKREEYKQ